MGQSQLFQGIIELSTAKFWDAAKLEWKISDIEMSDEWQTCLCGQYPIRELCHLINTSNGNSTTVGNCCVKKFMPDLSSNKLFTAFKRVRKNIEKSLNSEFIQLAFERNWIDQLSRDFYLNIMRKTKLSEKQRKWKVSINEKIVFREIRRANVRLKDLSIEGMNPIEKTKENQ